jgi:opacity protein-like surface antigen
MRFGLHQKGRLGMYRVSGAIVAVILLGPASVAGAGPLASGVPSSSPLKSVWDGFYAGFNAGYDLGPNSGVAVNTVPVQDDYVAAIRNYWAMQGPLATYSTVPSGFTSLANIGTTNARQTGPAVGGQFGYNFHLLPKFVFGVEADVQSTNIGGSGSYAGAFHGSSFLHIPAFAGDPDFTRTLLQDAVGRGTVAAGVDWLATARARLGWLATPTLLLFGTGGVASGAAHASAAHSVTMQETYLFTIGNAAFSGGSSNWSSSGGAGNYDGTRIGWAAGGGGEWMFMPKWSLKGEALYYDLGSATFASNPIVIDIPPGGVYAGFGRQIIPISPSRV